MKPGIYIIISPSGKFYVGQTIDLNRRKKEYSKHQCSKQPKIFNSLSKYGWNRHRWFEIECSVDKLNDLEVKIKLDVINILGWSKTLFCEIHDTDGGPKSDSTRLKISQSNIGKHNVPLDVRINSSIKRKQTIKNNGGYDWGDKISQNQKGKPKYGHMKSINQYDKDGTFIKTWIGVSEAELFYGGERGKDNISACARGKQKTAYNYVWKYN
jgi:group I intron endonuclease